MKYTALYLSVLVFAISCGKAEEPNRDLAEVRPSAPKVNEFDAELKAFRNADFDYIFVIRRKDGGPMDSDDKLFIRNNAHYATNRFTLSKDEKVIFAGSNYKFEDAGLAALKDRFDVSDYSKTQELIDQRKQKRREKEEKRKKENLAPQKAERKRE